MTTNNSWDSPFPSTKGNIIVGDGSGQPSVLSVGSNNTILISDSSQSTGIKWSSSGLPTNQLYSVSGTLTSTQIKSLYSSPITVISAPGSGNVIIIIDGSLKYTYGGNNVFTGTGDLGFTYSGTALSAGNVSYIMMLENTYMTSTNSRYRSGSSLYQASNFSVFDNTGIQITNTNANYGGNAANDNIVSYNLIYTIWTP